MTTRPLPQGGDPYGVKRCTLHLARTTPPNVAQESLLWGDGNPPGQDPRAPGFGALWRQQEREVEGRGRNQVGDGEVSWGSGFQQPKDGGRILLPGKEPLQRWPELRRRGKERRQGRVWG